jgi:hypothetical protein
MLESANVYCDESCHLENDRQPIMVLGALLCRTHYVRDLSLELRQIKRSFGIADDFEIKWSKVSPGKKAFYEAVLDFFFDSDELVFRGLVVANKQSLRHGEFQQTHDEWYYKMYYQLLLPLARQEEINRGFLDIKDTRGGVRVRRLERYLAFTLRKRGQRAIPALQQVHSREVPALQLTDLLVGCLSYHHRGLESNAAKEALVQKVRFRTGLSLDHSTGLTRKKYNLFIWEATPAD